MIGLLLQWTVSAIPCTKNLGFRTVYFIFINNLHYWPPAYAPWGPLLTPFSLGVGARGEWGGWCLCWLQTFIQFFISNQEIQYGRPIWLPEIRTEFQHVIWCHYLIVQNSDKENSLRCIGAIYSPNVFTEQSGGGDSICHPPPPPQLTIYISQKIYWSEDDSTVIL